MSVLDKAESLDGYRTACKESQPNAEAREGQLYELASISKSAETFLTEAVRSIPLLKGCEIVILDSSADNGFPHTRPPNYICLPASMCKEAPATDNFKETLLHEAIHIHQRQKRALWDASLRRAGWTPVPAGTIPQEFLDRIRLNPDTLGIPFFAFNEYHIPLPLFPPVRPSLQNAQVKWFDRRTGSLFHEPPKEFVKKYGTNIHQPEHPYEIYAELFSAKKSNDISEALSKI
jgi:hypothetical protein